MSRRPREESLQIQKRPSEQQMQHLLRKQVRRSEECKYDFSSPALRKTQPNRSRKPSTCKPQLLQSGINRKFRATNPPHATKDNAKIPGSPTSDPPDQVNTLHPDGIDDYQLHEDQTLPPARRLDIHITEVQAYVHDLKQYAALASCDHTLKNFVLQDFSTNTYSLKPHSFVFVCRCAKSFSGQVEWVYWCSCDPARSKLVDSLRSINTDEYTTFEQQVPGCLHIRAAKVALEEVDAIHDISPDLEFTDHTYTSFELEEGWEVTTEQVVSLRDGEALCVKAEGSYGVVYLDSTSIACATCRYGTSNCKHVNHILALIEELPTSTVLSHFKAVLSSLPSSSTTRRERGPICQSQKCIPFNYLDAQEQSLKEPLNQRLNIVEGVAHLYPTATIGCSLCGQINCWSDETYLEKECLVVTDYQLIPAKVYCRKCSTEGCSGKVHFDEQSKCLLDMSTFLITYEVLRRLMYHFVLGKATIFTEYSVLREMQSDAGNSDFSQIISYNYFRVAWYSYLHLLDIDYSEGFVCSYCGNQPNVIIMDATSLAFRKELDSWKPILQTETKPQLKAGRYSERILIDHKRTRSLLSQFAEKGLARNEAQELTELVHHHAPFLSELLLYLLGQCGEVPKVQCPEKWMEFIAALASPSPVCALIHPSEKLFLMLCNLKDTSYTPELTSLLYLQQECPVLFELLQRVTSLPRKLLFPVITEMIKKAKAPFDATVKHNEEVGFSLEDDAVSFFPNLSKLRPRSTYTADMRKKTKLCTKYASGHPTLLPGVFTLFCKHGICYGFQIMRVTESPNTAFTILYTRFLEAPQVVIYDNGCNLHNYCLNREPLFFEKTWFMIDRFHWPNHVGCSVGYQMSLYPQFKELNSQIVEQSNSVLKRAKPSLSYMNMEHFLLHLKLILWYRNKLAREKNISA